MPAKTLFVNEYESSVYELRKQKATVVTPSLDMKRKTLSLETDTPCRNGARS